MTDEGVTMQVMAKDTPPITLRIDDELMAKLQAVLDKQRVKPTMSEMIRLALREFVEKELADDPKRPKR